MIFDIIQNIIMLILPMALVMTIILYMSSVFNKRVDNAYKQLKALVCVFLTVAIVISSMIIMLLNVYWVAVALEELEEISYIAKESIFTCVMFIWNIIGVILIFNIWKHIYYTNYDLINRVKEDWKKIKERKHYGRHKKTNKL